MTSRSRPQSPIRRLLDTLAGAIARGFGGSGAPARLCVALVFASCLLPFGASTASADTCSNAQFRYGYGAYLPHCRAYEQVTPVDKDGANPVGADSLVQASTTGDRITFFTPAGIPGEQGSSITPLNLASRSSGGWSTQGLLPPAAPANFSAGVLGWTEDLSKVIDTNNGGLTLLDTASSSFQSIVAGTGDGSDNYFLADTTPGASRFIFEDLGGHLTPDAAPGQDNLYQWDSVAGANLVGRVPSSGTACNDASGPACVTPANGSFAGPYNWQIDNTSNGGAAQDYYTPNTISADGSRMFFTTAGSAQLYVRENGVSTVQVSASQRTVPDPNGAEPAAFMAATPDGSHVFFASCQKLTDDSTAVSTGTDDCLTTDQGQDLYDYNVGTGALTDLTVDSNVSDTLGAAVQGVLGASDDGSYVYFVANGVLASGASPGTCRSFSPGIATTGTCNVYLWHNGTVTFIAHLTVNFFSGNNDGLDFEATPGNPFHERTSRVSADGRVLLFQSTLQLTGYDNAGTPEFYRYDAGSGALECVSCNPTGAPPTGRPTLQSITSTNTPLAPMPILTRNLSADGGRFFFETPDALVPQDTNGAAGCPLVSEGSNLAPSCRDVYEWEADGSGSCRSSADNGGCLSLISTGKSPDPSSFADASPSGDDVFFFTSQPLVGSDQDQLVDIYDARVGGGLGSQNPSTTTACTGEDCKPPPSVTPPPPTAASVTFAGPGNLSPGPANLSPGAPTSKVKLLSRIVHGTTFFVRVRAPSPGQITITGAGINTVRKSMSKAGTYRLRITLTANEKKALKRKRKLKLKLRVAYAPAGGASSSVTFRITDKA